MASFVVFVATSAAGPAEILCWAAVPLRTRGEVQFLFVQFSWFSFPLHQFFSEYFSRRFKPQALARCRVEAVANQLQMLICECRGVGLAGKVTTQPVVGVLDRSFLPRRGRIAEPGGDTNALLQILPGTELRPAIKGDRLSDMGRERGQAINQALHDWFRLPIWVL